MIDYKFKYFQAMSKLKTYKRIFRRLKNKLKDVVNFNEIELNKNLTKNIKAFNNVLQALNSINKTEEEFNEDNF